MGEVKSMRRRAPRKPTEYMGLLPAAEQVVRESGGAVITGFMLYPGGTAVPYKLTPSDIRAELDIPPDDEPQIKSFLLDGREATVVSSSRAREYNLAASHLTGFTAAVYGPAFIAGDLLLKEIEEDGDGGVWVTLDIQEELHGLTAEQCDTIGNTSFRAIDPRQREVLLADATRALLDMTSTVAAHSNGLRKEHQAVRREENKAARLAARTVSEE